MSHQPDYRDDLVNIRSMMERSSRFISLSGLSGVFAGVFALIGVAAAYFKLQEMDLDYLEIRTTDWELVTYLLVDAIIVAIASVAGAIFLSKLNAKKHGLKTWDATSRRLVINLGIPLAAGGMVCLALIYHELIGLVAPATLVFYGLALINGSKYTLDDIRNLGLFETALGVIAMFIPAYGLWVWALGFGVLHIVYGVLMYYKYERVS